MGGSRERIVTRERMAERATTQGTALREPEALALLASYSLTPIEHRWVRSADEAAAAAAALGLPVALKIVSPDILHKSDAGGVRLDLRTEAEARAAYPEMMEAVGRAVPSARLEGALVAPMARPGTEVIVGMVLDAQFGPAMMFGLGGIFVEVYKDVAFRLIPLDERDAREMIAEIKGAPILRGLRGQPPRDIEALVGCILKVDRLIREHSEITELDLNPIVVYQQGYRILDAKIVRRL